MLRFFFLRTRALILHSLPTYAVFTGSSRGGGVSRGKHTRSYEDEIEEEELVPPAHAAKTAHKRVVDQQKNQRSKTVAKRPRPTQSCSQMKPEDYANYQKMNPYEHPRN